MTGLAELRAQIRPRYLTVSWEESTAELRGIARRHHVIMEEVVPCPCGLFWMTFGLLGDGAKIDAFLTEINAEHR